MIRRQEALDKTLRKYRGKPFEWGRFDCLTMARSHLVAMGHRGVPKLPKYSDAKGALKALKATGHNDLAGLLDGLLPRIRAAEMLPGDIALLAGEGALDAIHICVGHKTFSWHVRHEEPVIMVPHEIKAAWRG